jgi:hypothetical protein
MDFRVREKGCNMTPIEEVGGPAEPARPSHARVSTAPRGGMANANISTRRPRVPNLCALRFGGEDIVLTEDQMMSLARRFGGQVVEV